MIETNNDRLESLQIGRALAALAVVFHHMALSVHDVIAEFPHPLQAIFDFGWIGVDFFFVLSGFIIYHSTYKIAPNKIGAQSYALQRIIRVYVPYIPVSVAVILLYTFVGSNNTRPWGVFSSLTLLPTGQVPALSVAWTLQHEIVFYAIFAIGFFSQRLFLTLGVWAAFILVAFLLGQGREPPFSVGLSLINLEFIAGVAAAVAFRRGLWCRSAWPYALTAVALLIWWFGFQLDRSWSVLGGIAIAGLILPMVYRDAVEGRSFHRHALLAGSASYAVYLVHNPLLSITTRLAAKIPLPENIWIAALIGVIASIAVGFLYHLLYEIPATRFVKKRLNFRATHAPATKML